MPSTAVRLLLVLLISTLLLAGCAQERVEDLITRIATPVDMSGHWEVDYARSDNFQDQLNLVSRRIQREAARRVVAHQASAIGMIAPPITKANVGSQAPKISSQP